MQISEMPSQMDIHLERPLAKGKFEYREAAIIKGSKKELMWEIRQQAGTYSCLHNEQERKLTMTLRWQRS